MDGLKRRLTGLAGCADGLAVPLPDAVEQIAQSLALVDFWRSIKRAHPAMQAAVFGLGPQRVLQAALTFLDPAFDFIGRQVELPAGQRHRRLPLDDLQHQRRLAPGRPALDLFFVHHCTHRCLL
nr:hypothetical protein [Xanthomonas axonopodis]